MSPREQAFKRCEAQQTGRKKEMGMPAEVEVKRTASLIQILKKASLSPCSGIATESIMDGRVKVDGAIKRDPYPFVSFALGAVFAVECDYGAQLVKLV